MSEPRRFDVRGPLPTGVTVLEASAGTGKTYTIAALAARYVASGIPLHEILLVTFTRLATGELRERVRERLLQTEERLTHVLDGQAAPDDAVVQLLAAGPVDEVRARRDRLAHALADFDAATIATTHGFCLEALSGLGIVGDVEQGCDVTEDAFDLLEDVVDDLYVRRFGPKGSPAFSRHEAHEIARAAVGNLKATILPLDTTGDGRPAMRARLAGVAREELERRKRLFGVLTFDDLLTRLNTTLADPATGGFAVAKLRDRYKIALVDEFQDTDPIQWDIVRRAFAENLEDAGATQRALVLIGDPKQAIYAFRGADVHAYLEAARVAGDQQTLATNWRSDQDLISALDAMFGGARLGHDEILYRTVQAVPAHRDRRLHGTPSDAALRIRIVQRDNPAVAVTKQGMASAQSAREHVADDVAADIVAVLTSNAEIEERSPSGATTGTHRVGPGDLAVLVRKHSQATLVHDALRRVRVPVVINGAGSVFAGDGAKAWQDLLQALERPTSGPRAHAAALTPFLGWTAQRVAEADDETWESVHRRLHGWARVLRTRGVASLLEVITTSERLTERVLEIEDGERRMTDLRHVGQLLHQAAVDERLGTTALAGWLRARIRAAIAEGGDEERTRRLESDADAVQVLTIHRSKGLEFPIVYCPFLWDTIWRDDKVANPVVFHDDVDDARKVDVALEGSAYAAHAALATTEEEGEELRLAYVALTRARHQAVIWWAGTRDTRSSPLSRLGFAREEDGTVRPQSDVPSDAEAAERFRRLGEAAAGCIAVERCAPRPLTQWQRPAPPDRDLCTARFDREIDRRWRRTSYSGITGAAHDPVVTSEPEARLRDDETPDGPPATTQATDQEVALHDVPLLLADMPGGTRVGTFVHHILEAVDFAAADLDAELQSAMTHELARRPLDVGDPAVARAGFGAVLETPLGSAVGDVRLADIAVPDRLDELEFELPLVGGDAPSGRLTLDALADLLRAHVPTGTPLHGYADRLGDERLQHDLRGYLTGSIDAVLRLPDGRFAIVDYKTNRLGGPDVPLTAWHYRPAALDAAMQDSHYGLQALLYTVAVHRYLRWRLENYDPDRHLAGVLYLFVRGMVGTDTPVVNGERCGVFTWQPSGVLVRALSDVLDRGAVTA
ncbi:AAA family ATPase [Baekduia soli]|uniref:RecBCD enzyme subunit RecB n=1 Tax=Baekduia soli TaxID=496014 RepID=A0A5B8U2T6_9ACTN|nr:UvrD-helicase domain-containing protein [Baekduia soli]QEC47293.1 AAA family ATPase [Baekduia soli]